jgi:spore coat polysaccharide biosynthesis predicted glycosyltransferase SpsG
MRDAASRIAVIDDLADRAHDCALLLDQSLLPGSERRYAGLLPPDCVTLLGPRFTLIREEFRHARAQAAPRSGEIRRILMAFGGVDLGNFTAAALEMLRGLDPVPAADVVIGAANPWRAAIESACARTPSFTCHVQTTRMAELMARADLALIAGGFTSYEAAFMGLPSVLFPMSAIQAEVSAEIAAHGAAISAGMSGRFDESAVVAVLRTLRSDPVRCRAMAQAATQLFDGLGTQRVTERLLDA